MIYERLYLSYNSTGGEGCDFLKNRIQLVRTFETLYYIYTAIKNIR